MEMVVLVRVRFHIIRNALIENVGKYQSCMVSKLRIIWKQTGCMFDDHTINSRASSCLQGKLRVRFHIIRNALIENVGKSQSCMVSKLRIIWKQTV